MDESFEVEPNTNFIPGFIYVGNNKIVLPESWKEQGDGIYNFQSQPGDVWVMTQPRSGTTLTQELAWLLSNDLNFEEAKKFTLEERFPQFESSLYEDSWNSKRIVVSRDEASKQFTTIACDLNKYSYEVFGALPSPRYFKTHLPLYMYKNLLESGARIIYVVRNPKDRFVSHYRFISSGDKPLMDFNVTEFWNLYKNEHMLFCPYWDHIKTAWAQRDHPNVLFMFYEHMRLDLSGTIRKVADFLGKPVTDNQIQSLIDHLDIDTFRKNPMVNTLIGCPSTNATFIGEGSVGGYKEVLTPEIEKEMDEWVTENLENTGIVFPSLQK